MRKTFYISSWHYLILDSEGAMCYISFVAPIHIGPTVGHYNLGNSGWRRYSANFKGEWRLLNIGGASSHCARLGSAWMKR